MMIIVAFPYNQKLDMASSWTAVTLSKWDEV